VLAEATSLNHNVLNNLISNAIKFSRPGSTIDISSSVSGDNILLIVQDHGIGMPKDLIANVFRTDKPTSRTGTSGEKGTGFGMPVVNSYMQRFGGSISIESVTETESPATQGTRVTLSFKKAS
jgi:signal transduction histidine kinase